MENSKKSKGRGRGFLVIGLLFLIVCFAFLAIGYFSPDTNDTSQINIETPDQFREVILGAISFGNRDIPRLKAVDMSDTIIIRWSINDNVTMDTVKRSAMIDIKDMLETINRTDLDYSAVVLEGFYPIDGQETLVIQAAYSVEMINQTDWNNFITDNVYNVASKVDIHPAFE